MPWTVESVAWSLGQVGPSLTGSLFQAWIALELANDLDPTKRDRSLSVVFARFLPLAALGAVLYLGGVVGFLALIVPGVLWGLATFVAMPAAAVERVGVIPAIRRSLELTRGHRSTIFGYVLVAFAPLTLAAMLLDEIATGWAPLGVANQAPVVLLGIRPLTDALIGLFSAAYGAAFYQELVARTGSGSK
jgi:hypothetical protein